MWSATILCGGELFAGHRVFVMKQDAIDWAKEQRKEAERGWRE
jgi:hypothetical protein